MSFFWNAGEMAGPDSNWGWVQERERNGVEDRQRPSI